MGCAASKPMPGPSSAAGAREATASKPIIDPALAPFVTTDELRNLFTDGDGDEGSAPIRILKASWLLKFYQTPGNQAKALLSRPALERGEGLFVKAAQPLTLGAEPFVTGRMLDRILLEVESGDYQVSDSGGVGELHAALDAVHGRHAVKIAFPSLVVLSHMWLDPSHPDPNGRHLRQKLLFVVEWLYSERVRQLMYNGASPLCAKGSDGKALSDEAIHTIADFGIVIDWSSIMQREGGRFKAPREEALFHRGRAGLATLFAHHGVLSLLSSRLPAAYEELRSRGHLVYKYEERGWTLLEESLGRLLKPPEHILDVGGFTLDGACEEHDSEAGPPERIGATRFADRSVADLARQGSYMDGDVTGFLGTLVTPRKPPMAPEAFTKELHTRTFTDDEDLPIAADLYQILFGRILPCVTRLSYSECVWSANEFKSLGRALSHCAKLQALYLRKMPRLSDVEVTVMISGLAAPAKLESLSLAGCRQLRTVPDDIAALTGLKHLDLHGCVTLTRLPADLSAVTSLESLDLHACSALTTLPDLAALPALATLDVLGCNALTSVPELPQLHDWDWFTSTGFRCPSHRLDAGAATRAAEASASRRKKSGRMARI